MSFSGTALPEVLRHYVEIINWGTLTAGVAFSVSEFVRYAQELAYRAQPLPRRIERAEFVRAGKIINL